MSTIEFAAPVATRLRITARGRRVLAWLVALPIVVALAMGVLSGGVALASREPSVPAGGFETVTVLAGESLWSIAQDVAPASDPRDVVDDIMRLNALTGAGVAAGQRLSIPAEYTSVD